MLQEEEAVTILQKKNTNQRHPFISPHFFLLGHLSGSLTLVPHLYEDSSLFKKIKPTVSTRGLRLSLWRPLIARKESLTRFYEHTRAPAVSLMILSSFFRDPTTDQSLIVFFRLFGNDVLFGLLSLLEKSLFTHFYPHTRAPAVSLMILSIFFSRH